MTDLIGKTSLSAVPFTLISSYFFLMYMSFLRRNFLTFWSHISQTNTSKHIYLYHKKMPTSFISSTTRSTAQQSKVQFAITRLMPSSTIAKQMMRCRSKMSSNPTLRYANCSRVLTVARCVYGYSRMHILRTERGWSDYWKSRIFLKESPIAIMARRTSCASRTQTCL